MRVNGTYLRLLREERGYTLREFARMAGVSPAYLSQIEAEKKTPSVRTLQKLARSLNLAKEELLVLTEPTPGISLAKKLRALRERQGLGQEELARLAGIMPSYLAEIEQGYAYPPYPVLKRLAEALGVEPGTLFPVGENVLGQRLKAVRQAQQLTLEELARQAGLSPALLSHIEQGRVCPSLQTMEKLARVLGTAACLFIMEGEMLEPLLGELTPQTRALLSDPRVIKLLQQIRGMSQEELDFLIKMVSLWSEKQR